LIEMLLTASRICLKRQDTARAVHLAKQAIFGSGSGNSYDFGSLVVLHEGVPGVAAAGCDFAWGMLEGFRILLECAESDGATDLVNEYSDKVTLYESLKQRVAFA